LKPAGIEQTSAVGLFPAGASPYGLLDMAGNVWQWTRTRWGTKVRNPDFRYPYAADDGREDDAGAAIPVLRGGSWYNDPAQGRCAYRYWNHPDDDDYDVGLRVALSLVNSDF
jgi:iron(II)-dependent oxidoreductase